MPSQEDSPSVYEADAPDAAPGAAGPSIISDIILANEMFNLDLEQQMLILQQQAMNQVVIAAVARFVALMGAKVPPHGSQEADAIVQQLHETIAGMRDRSRELAERAQLLRGGGGRADLEGSRGAAGAVAGEGGAPEPHGESAATLAPPEVTSARLYALLVEAIGNLLENTVAAQQRLYVLSDAVVAKSVSLILNAPLEEPAGASDAVINSNSEPAAPAAETGATLSGVQSSR